MPAAFKRYLVKANSDNEHYNADLDFAIITFSKELLAYLSELRSAFIVQQKKHPDIHSWSVRFNGVSFFSYAAAEAMLGDERFEEVNSGSGDDPYKLLDAEVVNLEKFNVELSDEMVLHADGVWWKVNPRDSAITIGTEYFPWIWFSQCTNCGLRREEHARGKCLFSSTRYRAEAPGLARRAKARRKLASDGSLPKLHDVGEGSR